MVEKLLEGSKRYYMWLLFLVALIAACFCVYLYQLFNGLGVTGMSRDVSWGLYISQFTYLVGVAASAVMLVLPTYFHHYQKFKIMIIFGEFMAIAAVIMCCLFIVVDLGQPQRMMNVLLHPTPNSVMFYDMIVLIGYLLLNCIIGWVTLEAERHDTAARTGSAISPTFPLSGPSPSTLSRLSCTPASPDVITGCPPLWLPLPVLRLLFRTCHSASAHPRAAQAHWLQPRQSRHQDSGHHYHLCHVPERLLLSA